MSTSPTYVVELTPPGRAAVAVVLVAGPEAIRAVNHSFTANSGWSIVDPPCGRIVVGRWGGPTGEELVVCRRDEEEIEIHCHGGAAAVRAVVDALVAHGCETTHLARLANTWSRLSETRICDLGETRPRGRLKSLWPTP